jgi:hypothetical protein
LPWAVELLLTTIMAMSAAAIARIVRFFIRSP